MIRRSPGLLVAAFGDGAAVYDLVAETFYLVGPLAAGLLADESPIRVATLAEEAAGSTGLPAGDVLDQILEAAGQLQRLGLVDRRSDPPLPPPLAGSSRSTRGCATGRVHAVLDHGIVFRSRDVALLDEVDAFLGMGLDSRAPTVSFSLEAQPGGGIMLSTADEWVFPTRDGFFAQLLDPINQYAARSTSLLVLHSGGVRAPDGRVVLLPGPMDAGKSTLTAALVRSGCDYLGDESIGVREHSLAAVAFPKPLTVDASTRRLLGLDDRPDPHLPPESIRSSANRLAGDVGPVDEIVLPRFRAGRTPEAARLTPPEALRALISNTLNLGRSGEAGLRTLCALAERTPVTAIAHGDSLALAASLVRHGPGPLIERTRLQRIAVDDISLRRDGTVAFEPIDVGEPGGLLVRPPRPSLVLDRVGAEVWQALGEAMSVSRVVSEVTPPTGDPEITRDLVRWYVDALGRHGLLERRSPTLGADAHAHSLSGRPEFEPWAGSARWLPRALPDAPVRHEPFDVYRWRRDAVTKCMGGLRITTDCAAVVGALDLVSWPPAPASAGGESALAVELKQVPGDGSGAFLRIAGGPPTRVATGDEVAAIAVLLAGRFPGRTRDSLPLAEVWALEEADDIALHVGAPADRSDTHGSADPAAWRLRFGLRIERGEVVWVPDRAAASDWIEGGADPDDARRVWRRRRLVAIGAPRSQCTADGWAEVVDALLVDVRDADRLHHLVAGGRPRLVLGDRPGLSVAERIHGLLGAGRSEPRRHPGPQPETPRTPPPRPGAHTDDLVAWAEALGRVEVGDQSAKIDEQAISIARPLLSVLLPRDTHGVTATRLFEAVVRLGLTPDSAAQAAEAALDVHHFYVGEQRGTGGPWRRKLYVHRPTARTWADLAPAWPARLADATGVPAWLGWKWDNRSAGQVVRSVDLAHLAGADTVQEGIAPVLSDMGEDWADLIRQFMARAGIHPLDAPMEGDAITIDEDGRRSADLSLSGRWRRQSCGDVEGELRWVAALCGHARIDADALVDWAGAGRMANVIFGTCRRGRPFVNAYIRRPPSP